MDSSLLADLFTNFYGIKFSGSSLPPLISAISKHNSSEHKIDIKKIKVDKCNKIIEKLKLLLIKNYNQTKEFIIYSKYVYEIGSMLSVASQDFSSFERFYAPLQDIYLEMPYDFISTVVIGLKLFHLLTNNCIGEFHSLLELYPQEIRSSKPISYVINLEHLLTDGNFNKLLKERQDPPIDLFIPFIKLLKDVTRFKVASCIEFSFSSISLSNSAKMLHLEVGQMDAFVKQLNKTKFEQGEPLWNLKNGFFTFSFPEMAHEIPVWDTLQNTISYATQIERII